MKPSDIFFRLMEAAQERGIGQCKRVSGQDRFGSTPVGMTWADTRFVCVRGLMSWGHYGGAGHELVSYEEVAEVIAALPHDSMEKNDDEGWTFPDFYEYLKDKEATEQSVEVAELVKV